METEEGRRLSTIRYAGEPGLHPVMHSSDHAPSAALERQLREIRSWRARFIRIDQDGHPQKPMYKGNSIQ